ncbi:hypothetical protein CRG98_049917, partial [Punica granatum]
GTLFYEGGGGGEEEGEKGPPRRVNEGVDRGPGTVSRLLLRIGQSAFVVAFIGVMVAAIGFSGRNGKG